MDKYYPQSLLVTRCINNSRVRSVSGKIRRHTSEAREVSICISSLQVSEVKAPVMVADFFGDTVYTAIVNAMCDLSSKLYGYILLMEFSSAQLSFINPFSLLPCISS